MSNQTDPAPPPRKKGGFLKKALVALILLGAGVGGTYAAFASGMIGGPGKKEPAEPQLVLKGEKDPYARASKEGKDAAPETVFGQGGNKYRTAYFNFSEDFTSNLRDGASLIQLSLAASTQRDGRVLMWLAEHETAVRSRILVEIAATDEVDVTSPGGKERLQKRLTKAVNEVLTAHEGFGGVDNIYFRSFIVQ